MSWEQTHRSESAKALAAAEALKDGHATWSMVPLFYSAMHLVHAVLADHPQADEGMRHPKQHKSYWNDGVRTWGTTDVVTAICPAKVSRAYKSLFNASHTVRYGTVVLKDTSRFWEDFQVIAEYAVPAD